MRYCPTLMRPVIGALVGALLCTVLASTAYAQREPGKVSSVVRESFALRAFDDIELPQGSVRAVHVSQRGYLWAGTREGLVQYKAGQQRVWQQSDNGQIGLPSGMINTIYEDATGNIWVGTARGVAYMPASGDDFLIVTRSLPRSSRQLDVIAFAAMGERLFAVTKMGEVLDLSTTGATTLLLDENRSGSRFPQAGDRMFLSASANSSELYLGTQSLGLFRVNVSEQTFDVLERIPTDSAVVEITATDDNLIWLERNAGLITQPIGGSPAQRRQVEPLADDSKAYYRAMSARSARSAWFAAGPNVMRVRGGKADIVRLPGRGNNEVRSITVDSTGNIWIGTYYGLFYVLDTPFDSLQTAGTYESGVVSSLASAGDTLFVGGQNLWVGDVNGDRFEELGLTQGLSAADSLRLSNQSTGQDPITALGATESKLLVGYYLGGIDVVDRNTGQVSHVPTLAEDGAAIENGGVTAIAQVDSERWLASFFMYGLTELRVDSRGGTTEVALRRISDLDALIGIYRLEANRFLAVSESELFIVAPQEDGAYRLLPFDASPQGIVFAVEPDGLGGVYLGIENVGVRHLTSQMINRGVFAPQPVDVVEKYLARRTVWHLLLDEADTLWATTNNGVFVFDLPRGELISHTTYRDGLPSNEFEYGPSASLLTESGEKLFVSSTGPVAFRSAMQPRETLIRLNWTDVSVNGESVIGSLSNRDSPLSGLRLPFSAVSDGVLKLEYGYDDHIRALDATYALRLTEDGEWLPGGRPVFTLTGLQDWKPITAEFAMLDSAGRVISEPLGVQIQLSPPWYMLWRIDVRVAIPACIVVGLLLFATQVRARNRQRIAVAEAAREREIVEAEMRGRLSEKEILLREIHHRVGNILSNFAANVRTMQRRARSDETRDTLEHLNARIKVQSAVHMLLQRSDRTDINVANMIRQVTAGARDFFGGDDDDRGINCHLDDVFMTYSKAQYLGLIVNELLTNSYKHGPESRENPLAEVTLRREPGGGAEFHYRDYGDGIAQVDIATAMETRRYGESGGLGQVIAMARELKGDPVLYCDQGMHLSFRLPNQLIRNEVEDLAI